MALYRLVLVHQLEHVARRRAVRHLELLELRLRYRRGELVREVADID